jgi:L-lactate dehydrogenase complex protein LldE
MLLEQVAGLELLELPDAETCCGFGGTFAVKYPDISVAMGQQKVEQALNLGAEYLISTDLSCLMHMQGYVQKNNLPLKTMHLADVLSSGW